MPDGRSNTKKHILLVVFLVILWEVLVHAFSVSEIFLPRPSKVFLRILEGVISGELLFHIASTGAAVFGGLLLALIVSVPAGIIIGSLPKIEEFIRPYPVAFASIPLVAISPLLVLWIGIGFNTKLVCAYIGCSFPLFITTSNAAKNLGHNYIEAAMSLGLGFWVRVYKVIFPLSLPSVFAGCQIAFPRAIVGVVVAEIIASRSGLGWLIMQGSGVFDVVTVFSSIVCLSGLAGSGAYIIATVERHATGRWKAMV